MHQSVKQTGALYLLQLVISSPLIHALVCPKSSTHYDSSMGPLAWEADDLAPKLSLPRWINISMF